MKKILATVLLMLPIVSMAVTDYGVHVPSWEDFVPPAFVDVQEPKRFGKLNVVASYWYKRKVEFEAELEKCRSLEGNDERFACYETLKVNQYKENTNYNARVEARQGLNNGIPEMHNSTDTMLPLGNYINTYTRFMPSEVR